MILEPGSSLGPYIIQARIGSGGMGVVYRALDPKLDRMVAIKVLPPAMAEDPVRVARFEREAKAVAALSHPNVLGIFDFVRAGGAIYAVMELLEGENLRQGLRAGALPARKALDIATQLALGLAAAHEKGLLHRDIKPENIFLCNDGQVKLLDFGLAKPMPRWNQARPPIEEVLTAACGDFVDPGLPPELEAPGTRAGIVVGTMGYMSPEQIRGEELDARSDIFSFGVVLFELLTGQRAFRRETAAQTFEAILSVDLPEFRAPRGPLPPSLEHLVAHCLEKRPEARFQSMRDLAFALQHLDPVTTAHPALPARRRRLPAWPLVLAAAAVLAVAGFLLHPGRPPVPSFHRIQAPQGTLESAFFGPDGRTVFYSARIQGRDPALFALYPDSEGPKALGLEDALLLGVSAGSELALLRHPSRGFGGRYSGTLAQAPGGGGSVKEILEDVSEAAWDGQSMALLAMDDQGRFRVEFPAGRTVLQEDGAVSGVKCLRMARDGGQLALVHSDSNQGTSAIETIDRQGRRRILFHKNGDSLAQTLTGLAWGPGGELWFSEWEGDQTTLWAVTGPDRRRLVWRGEGAKQLMDVSAGGRVLLASQRVRRSVFIQKDGATREISLLEGTQGAGLSRDGRTLLLLDSPALDGGTAQDQAYVYHLDQDLPVKLARGNPLTLTPDGGQLMLSLDFLPARELDSGATAAFQLAGLDPARFQDAPGDRPRFMFFMPTGPGRPRVLPLPEGFEGNGIAFLQGPEVIFQGQQAGQLAWYRWTPGKGDPVAFTPPGLGAAVAGLVPLSPDGSRFIATGNGRDWSIAAVQGGAPPQPVRGLLRGERIIGWGQDGASIFVRPELGVLPVAIVRLDLRSGARTPVRDFTPPDPAGHLQVRSVFMTPDARVFAFTWDRKLSELFLVEGLAR